MFSSLGHEPLELSLERRIEIFIVWAGGYSLLANAIHTGQIYGATTIKSGRVIAGKVIMTVEVTGLKGCGR